jgi:ketosteroid isomerase-like protein
LSERRLEAELLTLHDRFCTGFALRDADAVLATVADTSDLVVVTSEQPLLRGPGDLRAFLERYIGGPTTYSWAWDRRDTCISDDCAWLLAVGTETASGDLDEQATPYRMTLVARRVGHRWLFVQVHGSSPHHA